MWHNLFDVTVVLTHVFMARNSDAPERGDASEMQQNNATGANQNEQGQASFVAGSTTGGGSNFGQGSSHLGGESYRQGNETNEGSNYNNEAGRLANSSVGTNNEGSSSPRAAAGNSGNEGEQKAVGTVRESDTNLSSSEDRGQENKSEKVPHEGDRRNTELEESANLDTDNTTKSRRELSGSWSSATDNNTEQPLT